MKLFRQLLDFRPGDLPRVGRMFLLLGLIIATGYILKAVRSSLFLTRSGAEQLPYVYILVAVVLGVVAAAFSRLVSRCKLHQLFMGAVLVFSASLILLFWAAAAGFRYTAFVFYVWVSIFTILMPSLFWLQANYIFYSNEARRLFGTVTAGGILGSIAGGSLTSLLVRFTGTLGLLFVAAGLLLAIAALIAGSRAARRSGLPSAWPSSGAARPGIPRSAGKVLSRSSRALDTFL